MSERPELDDEEVRRRFRDMVADLDPDPPPPSVERTTRPTPTPVTPVEIWRGPDLDRVEAAERREAAEEADRPLPKPPPIDWARVSAIGSIGALAMCYSIAVLLITVVGIDLPSAVGVSAVVAFVVGFGLLISRLPRRRDPGDSDGARL